MIISIVNHTDIPKDVVQNTLRAINRQMGEDFQRYWHRDVKVRLEGSTGGQPNPEMPVDMRGDSVIYLWDEENIDDALGYHDLTAKGVPYGFVFTRLSEALGEPWSVTLSHEVLELAMDPEVNLLAEGPHPDPNERGRMVYHWYELCDAVQASTYKIGDTEVSNFVLPHYFTHGDEHENHNDFLGAGLSSFQVAEGGYAGFLDPETGQHTTWTRYRDVDAEKRLALKRKFLGASRAGRHQSFDQSSTLHRVNEVHCDAIIFELDRKNFTTASNGCHYAERIVAEVLGADWLVRPTRCDSFEFDAIYRGRLPLGFADAWSLTHDIVAKESVTFSEPSMSNPVAGETDLPTKRARTGLRASGLGGSTDLPGTNDKLWALHKIRASNAWDLINGEGKQPGDGIRIGHPDSGFRIHKELNLDRVLTDSDYDFLDDDEETKTPLGNHGLSTASVIMSGATDEESEISGPALFSDIVPLRVTKKGLFLPAPVLLMGGMRRLRDSIDYAVSIGCHVISMSLGGLPSRAVRKAIRRATDSDVIVLAAAGNQVRSVVWPARYPETIAVAASNINDEPWKGSSRGNNVDITAPGESVWRARVEEDNPNAVGRGDGTSYAVALTAGVACLWLAYHGREKLIEHFGQGRLQDEFRALLKASANKSHQLPQGKYGAGLVDAEKLLKASLPKKHSSSRGRRSTQASSDSDEILRLAKSFHIDTDKLSETSQAELLMADAFGAFVDETKFSTTPAEAPITPKRKRVKAHEHHPRPSMRGLSSKLRQSLSEK